MHGLLLVMNFATVEEYQLGRMARKIQLANFKRKIRDGEISPEFIAKRYRIFYPNEGNLQHLKWDYNASKDCHVLSDSKQPRFILSKSTKALFVPPPGCRIREYHYEEEIWTPQSTPQLTPDALKSIFKHLPGWELVKCRLVCRKWCQVATDERSLWRIHSPPRSLPHIQGSPFRMYVQNMFINATDRQVIDFFFSHPQFFVYVCKLFVGSALRGKIVMTDNELSVHRFTALKEEAVLVCDRTRKISIQVFLDAHRQQLLIKQ